MPVGLRQSGHRLDELGVEPLKPVAARLGAKRRLEPHIVVVQLGRVVLVVEHPHQAGVGDRDVVALDVVLDDDLPVRRLAITGWSKRGQRVDPVGRQALREIADEVAQRGGAVVEVDEHEPAQLRNPHRVQPEPALVELLAERLPLGDADQAAVEAIRPAVVAAADRALALTGAAQQAGGAVAAYVPVGAELAAVVADDEHRLGARLGGEVAARTRQRGDVTRELPRPLKDQLVLGVEQSLVEVQPGREGSAGGRVGDGRRTIGSGR